jgi:hypothetical protein
MIVYLTKEKDEIQVHQISPDQETKFLALYGDKILMVGDNVPEVLRRFNELPVIICNGV